MHAYIVGQRYRPGVAALAPGVNYNFRGGQHELLLIVDRLKQSDIEAVRHGPASFGVLVHQRIVFFLYRFESAFEWSDAPYSIWQLSEAERIPPDAISPQSRALLSVFLVDADHNRIEAMRLVSLAPPVTAALYLAINSQLSGGKISIGEYQESITEAYKKWPTTAEMVRDAITCQGGK